MAIAAFARAAARKSKHAFGVPGSGQSLELIQALSDHGVAFHSVYHEGAAAIMAGTVGRLSDDVTLAIAIKGPGLANMVAGMAACTYENLPILAVSEAYGPGTPLAKAHKRLDQGALTAAVAKGRRYLAAEGPGYDDLAAWSKAETSGPVFVELAGAVSTEKPVPKIQSNADTGDVLDSINGSQRPAIIAGTYALRAGLSPILNRMQIPVFSTAAAKGAVHEGLPHAAGVYTGIGLSLTPEFDLVNQADLVVGIGLRASEVLAAAPFSCGAVNLDPVNAPGMDGFAFDGIARDPGQALEALTQKAWGVEEVVKATAHLRQHLLSPSTYLPAHAFDAVARAFVNGVRMVIDTGYFCTIGEHFWQASKGDWYVSSGSGRYMGIGLPQAIAATIQDPSVPTVLAVGDGGIAPFMSEAILARRLNLPLLVLHMSDGGYGSVRTRAIAEGLTQEPMLQPAASWRPAFDGFGFATAYAETSDALCNALADWRPDGGPLFVELPMDPDAYQDMVKGVR